MPKAKEVTVNVSKKIGMKNFSSDMVSASVTMTCEDGNSKAAFKAAWEACWAEIEGQMAKYQAPGPTKFEPSPDAGMKDNEPDWLKDGVKI